jgi:hypothetical protein
LATALAVVAGGALHRLDLQRDAVDGDDPQLAPAGSGVARLVRARHLRLAHLRHAVGVDGADRNAREPIIHSRPMVGVAKRVRTIDGMPTTKVSSTPTDAHEQGEPRPRRRSVPGNGS